MSSPETAPSAVTEHSPNRHRLRGACRQIVEMFVCLAVAVVMFRAFEVEGYMISTGSMAPNLLGFHKRAICPTCGHQFALGLAEFEAEQARHWVAGVPEASETAPMWARCPNCGQDALDLRTVPPNQGDQLLVHKHAYLFRQPQRWEVIVFRNPQRSTQAYVKRVAGLPGERIQIVDGDVYANGRIARKGLASQRAIRLPVYIHDDRPIEDPEWQPRWVAQGDNSLWEQYGSAFVMDDMAQRDSEAAGPAWIVYRHWVRSGGSHETSVPVHPPTSRDSWSSFVLREDDETGEPKCPVSYDAESQRLSTVGALSIEWRDRLRAESTDPEFSAAVDALYEQSHLAPVTDAYGYNRSGASSSNAVRDLMLAAEVTVGGGTGEFVVQMTDGRSVYGITLDAGRGEIRLHVDGAADPVRAVPWPVSTSRDPMLLEFSLFDRQVLFAINGRLVFEPWPMPEDASARGTPPRSPVRFGGRGLRMRVSELKLYRDVYYVADGARNGGETPFQLAPNEYFVLGDNSPVSLDSRSWPHGGVDSHLLVGKPLLVHLPSRPGKLRIRDWMVYIRVPDLTRIRYIR